MRWLALFAFPCLVFGDNGLSSMTLEEKIGQLFVAPICPEHERPQEHRADWQVLLDQFRIGNAIVKQSDLASQVRSLNDLQKASKRPLLILADAEWGLGMRISDGISFPRNMTLGAVQDLQLLEQMGLEIGEEARSVGIHMNLAPVVDVNNNPNNRVIHMRSFGDQPEEVAKRGEALVRGMKQGHLLTCLKHFPGHGDTEGDSHFDLPEIRHSKSRLDAIELVPFKRGISAGTDAVMTAHLFVPSLDPNSPATLSYSILTSLLRGDLGFQGLIVTDALNMKALTDSMGPEEIALRAHEAGADLLLYGDHLSSEVNSLVRDVIPRAYRALLSAYRDGTFPLSRLDESVRRILQAKESFIEPLPLDTSKALALKETLFEAAITQLGPDFPPIDEETAYLGLGCPCGDLLRHSFSPDRYFFTEGSVEGLGELLSRSTKIVVSLRNIEPRSPDFGLSEELISLLQDLSERAQLAICVFDTPYAASFLPTRASIFIGYEEGGQKAMEKVLKKELVPTGVLPVSLSNIKNNN